MEGWPPFAQHEVTLPFTCMLAGLADYTPMHFGGAKLADTTWPHQVANAILLPAPLLVFAAHPANILGNPTVDMAKSIPGTWDETVVLPISQVGDVAAFARRKGTTWFVAVNNGPVGKTVRVGSAVSRAGIVPGSAAPRPTGSRRCQGRARHGPRRRPAVHQDALRRRLRGAIYEVARRGGARTVRAASKLFSTPLHGRPVKRSPTQPERFRGCLRDRPPRYTCRLPAAALPANSRDRGRGDESAVPVHCAEAG